MLQKFSAFNTNSIFVISVLKTSNLKMAFGSLKVFQCINKILKLGGKN